MSHRIGMRTHVEKYLKSWGGDPTELLRLIVESVEGYDDACAILTALANYIENEGNERA